MSIRTLLLLALLAPPLADAAFDDDGILYVSPAGTANNAFGRAIALRSDGAFHVAGVAYERGVSDAPTLELRRFDADGNEDAGFLVSQQHLGTMNLSPRGLLVQPDDSVVVAITLTNPATPTDSYTRIQRLRGDGSADPTFEVFSFDASSGADALDVLALQADGRILAAGYKPRTMGGGYAGIVARLMPDGSLDTGFGVDGYVHIDDLVSANFGLAYTFVSLSSINLLVDGRIQVTGTAEDSIGSYSEMLFVRLLPDGSRDPEFNGGEPTLYAHRSGNNIGFISDAYGADVSPEGVLLVGGSSTAGGSNRACLLQFDSDASLMAEACDDFGSGNRLTDVQLLPNGGAVGVGAYFDGNFDAAAMMAVYDTGLRFSGAFSGRFTSADRGHSLSAVAYDPYRRRLLSLGSGITMHDGLYANRWAIASDELSAALDATPDPVDLGPPAEVRPGEEASVATVLTGIDPYVRMPVRVSNGRFAVNGVDLVADASALPALGFLTAFDHPATLEAQVSHPTPLLPDEMTTTTLALGGVVRSNNLALTVGPVEIAAFVSLTRTTPRPTAVFSDHFESSAP